MVKSLIQKSKAVILALNEQYSGQSAYALGWLSEGKNE